jgi:hypothetical protein
MNHTPSLTTQRELPGLTVPGHEVGLVNDSDLALSVQHGEHRRCREDGEEVGEVSKPILLFTTDTDVKDALIFMENPRCQQVGED